MIFFFPYSFGLSFQANDFRLLHLQENQGTSDLELRTYKPKPRQDYHC